MSGTVEDRESAEADELGPVPGAEQPLGMIRAGRVGATTLAPPDAPSLPTDGVPADDHAGQGGRGWSTEPQWDGDAPGGGGRVVDEKPPRRRRWWLRLLVLLGLPVLIASGFAFSAWQSTQEWIAGFDGRLLPGTVIAGVDVTGMTPEQALVMAEAQVASQLDREITIRWDERIWTVTPRELGAASNAEAVVAEATAAVGEVEWMGLARMYWLSETLDFRRDLVVDISRTQLPDLVTDIAGEIDRPARDAELDWSSGWVELAPHEEGYLVLQTLLLIRLHEALEGTHDQLSVPVRTITPQHTSDVYSQVLLVRLDQRRLYLYQDGDIAEEYPVAIGLPSNPTPTGVFEIGALRHMPTWFNPAPDGWGRDMPARVGPGPSNPLGLRAINWNHPGGGDTLIRFHGTAQTWSIGQQASRGCVRLTNAAVVDLYDRVEPGSKIISIWG